MTEPLVAQVAGLATLIELERRVRRAASLAELRFIAVNETHGLVPYRQAALLEGGSAKRLRVTALSGVASPDRNAPYVVWLGGLARAIGRQEARALEPGTIEAVGAADAAGQWSEWLPSHAYWLPVPRSDEVGALGLLLARDQPFGERDRALLGYLAEALGEAFVRLTRPLPWPRRLYRALPYKPLLALLALALLGTLPVRLSALAPGEVVPVEPAVVRAPIDGVVEDVLVRPNEPVAAGQVLMRLDAERLESRIAVAQGELAMVEAEYRQTATQAVRDPVAKGKLAVLQSRLEQQRAEKAWLEGLRQRIEVRAPKDGIAIFDDAHQWIGRPVKIGERILVVADPAAVELELRLAVSDAIVLETGAPVRFFLNVAPEEPVAARLEFASYRATEGEDRQLTYRLRARFEQGGAPPRIGLKGTGKVLGQEVSLAYLLFRRPLAVLRQRLGL